MSIRTYLLLGGLIIVALFLALGYVFSDSKVSAPSPSPVGLPSAGLAPSASESSPGQGLVVSTSSGSTLATSNILNDPSTVEDPVNSGYYYLNYHPPFGPVSTTTATSPLPYLIEYISATNYFNVELLQEPIGATRLAAETYLAQHLRVSQGNLCQLNYMVSVPYWVNQTFSGRNLGFSFCTGATVLP